MIKKFFCTFVFLVFAVTLTSVAQLKVGYMDVQQVLNEIPERQNIEKQLDNLISEKQQDLRERANGYQDAVADYQQNQASMSQQQQETREQQLTTMQDSLNQYQQSIQTEVQQRRSELLAPIYDRIDKAIAAIADSMDLDFVLNKSTSAGENIVYFASDNKLDITQQVINRLNQK